MKKMLHRAVAPLLVAALFFAMPAMPQEQGDEGSIPPSVSEALNEMIAQMTAKWKEINEIASGVQRQQAQIQEVYQRILQLEQRLRDSYGEDLDDIVAQWREGNIMTWDVNGRDGGFWYQWEYYFIPEIEAMIDDATKDIDGNGNCKCGDKFANKSHGHQVSDVEGLGRELDTIENDINMLKNRPAGSGYNVDDKSIEVKDSKYQIKGFDGAGKDYVPYKITASGNVAWTVMSHWFDSRVIDWVTTPPAYAGGEYEVKLGFANWNDGRCQANLSSMLTDENNPDRSRHLLLAKFTDGDDRKLHYVPLGDVIGGAPADDTSITTNASHGAMQSGKASIYGFANASAGTIPTKAANGKIEWKSPAFSINGVAGTNFVFETDADSDVRFTVVPGANGTVHIKVGVHYK